MLLMKVPGVLIFSMTLLVISGALGEKDESISSRLMKLERNWNMLEKLTVLRSCEELKQSGVTISGYYQIDPDGYKVGHLPIEAYCNFEDGVTEILHDKDGHLGKVTECDTHFCYKQNYVYKADMEQITSLIQLSFSCEQEIEFHCKSASLKLGVWVDRQGKDQIYFDGSNSGRHTCSCDSTNTCEGHHQVKETCNCDAILPIQKKDIGKLTDTNALPVMAFKYGPLMTKEIAKVKVGRLRCRGRKEVVDNIPRSCRDLKLLGKTSPGFYTFQDGNHGDYPKMSYCQMDQPGYEEGMESNSHWLKFSSGPSQVYFAVRHLGRIVDYGVITYYYVDINQGGGMDGSTGVFTAPVAGDYEFKFYGTTFYSENVEVHVLLNGIEKVNVNVNVNKSKNTFSEGWVFTLKIGDRVSLKKHWGQIEGDTASELFCFIGSLL